MRPVTFLFLIALLAPGPSRATLANGIKSGSSPGSTAANTANAVQIFDESSPEVAVFRILNKKAANPIFDYIMPAITDLSRWRIILIFVWIALILAGGPKGRWAALMMIPLIAASDQLCASVIKPIVARARPCQVLGGVHFWHGSEGWITTPAWITRSYKSSFSFPSNHAANMTAAMLFLGLVYRKWVISLAVIAIAVSYSRIYVGVHWTSDVIAGMAIGSALAWAAWKALQYFCPGTGDRKWPWKS